MIYEWKQHSAGVYTSLSDLLSCATCTVCMVRYCSIRRSCLNLWLEVVHISETLYYIYGSNVDPQTLQCSENSECCSLSQRHARGCNMSDTCTTDSQSCVGFICLFIVLCFLYSRLMFFWILVCEGTRWSIYDSRPKTRLSLVYSVSVS